MFPILPIAIAALAGGAFFVNSGKPEKGVLTPARQLIFETAINEVKDTAKLKTLAKVFREQGLEPQADLLEKRAKLRELAPEVKSARKATFRKAMASKNPEAVRAIAYAFETEGANGAANSLREYADSLVRELQQTPLTMPKHVEVAAPVHEAVHAPEPIPSVQSVHTEETK
jgi:hypothetical protein